MAYRKQKSGTLTFPDLMGIGIGNTGGVGIFVVLGELTKNLAGPASLISIAMSAVAALLAGLIFAEFGTKFLKADNTYLYAYAYHGEHIAFIFGWALLLQFIAGSSSVAKGIMTFIDTLAYHQISDFLKSFVCVNFDFGLFYLDLFSPIIIIVLTVALACGMKDSILVKCIFTLCTIVLLASIIIGGSIKADIENWSSSQNNKENSTNSFTPFGFLGTLKAAPFAFYGFIGFDTLGTSAREMNHPQMYLPLATILSIIVMFFMFGGADVILCLTHPYTKHAEGAALPFAFEYINWIGFKWIIVVGAFFGFYSCLLGVTCPLYRTIRSMASDGLLFNFLANKYFKHQIPLWAVLFGCTLTCICAGLFTFKILVSLTTFVVLFVSTILAIDIILLRYISSDIISEAIENGSEGIDNIGNSSTYISAKQFFALLFHSRPNTPIKLTEKVVKINLIVFCFASLGLVTVITTFSNYLIVGAIEAIIPVVIFLVILLLTVLSMACQPKIQTSSSFKVPLVPFLPCLSIFINILLMTLLETITKVCFIIWMSVGIISHFFWFICKQWRGDLKSNSVYEINKLNALKLNESILKINSDKKTFYEGAINPVFELDEPEMTVTGDDEKQEPRDLKKDSTELTNQTVILEKSNETDPEPVTNKSIQATNDKIPELVHSQVKDESFHWECVAEIHTEDEFPEESYELQVVDNTYNFLSHIVEELPKDESDDAASHSSAAQRRKSGSSHDSENLLQNNHKVSHDKEKFNEENELNSVKDEDIKDFKEKLNVLLKNQINMNDTMKQTIYKYRSYSYEDWKETTEKANGVQQNIKTLNKSQMKNKLELLLAKGPPKRYSLKNSFNIKIKDTESENCPNNS